MMFASSSARSPLLALAALLAAGAGCSENRPPTAPPDTGSPRIEVRFPTTARAVDRDDDGLVDLEIAFADSGSGIDPTTIRLSSDRALKGTVAAGADLLPFWTVVRADSTGLVVEETVEQLLPRGDVTLTVAVSDRAGNPMTRTIALELPVAARHKVIDLQASLLLSTSVLATPDGRRVYVTTEERSDTAITVVDAERLEWVKTERHTIRGGSRMALDLPRNRLYAMSIDHPVLFVFDLASETFLEPIATSARGIGIAISPRRGKAYVGLEVETLESGLISMIDLDAGVEERVINLGIGSAGNPGDRMGMNALVFDAAESRLFASTEPTSAVQGVLVIDPDSGVLLDQIDVAPENPDILGGAIDMIRDGDRLALTSSHSLSAEGRVTIIPLSQPTALRFGSTGFNDRPIRLALAPDGRAYAITAAALYPPHPVLLMDTTTLEVIWEDRLPPPTDRQLDVVFRPDGHVFFISGAARDTAPIGAPNQLTVYLYR